MKKRLILELLLAVVHLGCASERLYITVIDDEGNPVSNATVRVGFTAGHVVFAEGKSYDYEGRTGEDGKAVVRFNGGSSDVYWSVKSDKYYPSEVCKETFLIEVKPIPPIFYNVAMLEHEKNAKITLYRKKDPQPMYAHTWELERKSPIDNGRYGFDLECFDWLPPHGKGKVADFYYVRDRKDIDNVKVAVKKGKGYGLMSFRNGTPNYPAVGDAVGRIEFDENCGAYVGKCTGNENFPTTYGADTTETYVSEFPIRIVAQKGNIWVHEGRVIETGEYMVIRSRVKCDERGKIVSAHYSKLLGPVGFGSLVVIGEAVFNPRPNDTNLEFDPTRNLYQGKKGRGMIP